MELPNTSVDVTFGDQESGKPVGIWIRVSTEDQAEGESPEVHRQRAMYYAQARGWEVVEVYDLSGVSGKTVLGHPLGRQMLEDVSTGKIKALVFSKLARLGRNTRELLEIAEHFKVQEADLVSIGEALDTSSPSGRLFFTILAAFAQAEREEISDRIRSSNKVRAKLGKTLGGPIPYGYRANENKELELDPVEAPIRKEIYHLYLANPRYKAIARTLNERGVRTKRGGKFTGNTIKNMLQDPISKGWRRIGFTEHPESGGGYVLKPEDQWSWGQVPAVVSEELWAECQELMEKNKVNKKATKPAVHLFSGLTHCHCGTKMYVPSKSKKYSCKDCLNKIPIDTLELIFQTKLSEFLSTPMMVSTALERSDELMSKKQALLQSVEDDIARVTQQMDRVYDLYIAEAIGTDGFKERYTPLESRKKELSKELPRLQAEIDVCRIQHASRAELIAEAQNLYQNWSTLPFANRRTIVEAIVEKIIVGKTSIDIDLVNPEGRGFADRNEGKQVLKGQELAECTKKVQQPSSDFSP